MPELLTRAAVVLAGLALVVAAFALGRTTADTSMEMRPGDMDRMVEMHQQMGGSMPYTPGQMMR
jgi:hypothetical protein